MLHTDGPPPLIATHADAPDHKAHALEDAGATVLRLPCTPTGVCFDALLDALADCDIRSLMVEGGAQVITSLLRQQRADHLILTVAPMFVGGLSALGTTNGTPTAVGDGTTFPELANIHYRWLGKDLVLHGDPVWPEETSSA